MIRITPFSGTVWFLKMYNTGSGKELFVFKKIRCIDMVYGILEESANIQTLDNRRKLWKNKHQIPK